PEQGAAKSTTQRVLRSLIDPNVSPLRTEPRNKHDLMIAAANGARQAEGCLIMTEQIQGDSPDIEAAIKALGDVIKGHIARPLYLRVEMRNGQLNISQVEYLTPEELAQLVKVNARTVYGWLDRGLLTFCKPQGTGQNLIPLRAALHWIDSSEKKKGYEPPVGAAQG